MPATITKEIAAYTFNELDERAKEKARDWYVCTLDDDWAECVIDGAKEDGKALGFDIDKVMWSGFWSQGDGASWAGRVNLPQFLDAHLKEDNPHHNIYVVMRELLRDRYMPHFVTVYGATNFYQHSGTMKLDDYEDGDLQHVIYNDDGEEDCLSSGVLEGAKVRDLCEGINYEANIEMFLDWALEEAKSFADDIYKRLESEYEYQTSDEVIAELADANEWLFDEDGSLI